MTRPASRRADHVQASKPAPPAPAPAPPPEGPTPAAPPTAPPRIFWGWRLAFFIWGTSFVILLLYEFLSVFFRVVGRWFRGG